MGAAGHPGTGLSNLIDLCRPETTDMNFREYLEDLVGQRGTLSGSHDRPLFEFMPLDKGPFRLVEVHDDFVLFTHDVAYEDEWTQAVPLSALFVVRYNR
jgi:hypothetical protein